MQAFHVQDAVVVLLQDHADAPAELQEQEHGRGPQGREQQPQRQERHENARAEGERHSPYRLRLRYSVLGSMPSTVAASSRVGLEIRTRRMCSASSCSSVTSWPTSTDFPGSEAPIRSEE